MIIAKFFMHRWQNIRFMAKRKRKYHRESRMSKAEVIVIMILFHSSGYHRLKLFCLEKVCKHMRHLFPEVVSYNRWSSESRVKLAWLCRVQPIFNDVNRDKGRRQSTVSLNWNVRLPFHWQCSSRRFSWTSVQASALWTALPCVYARIRESISTRHSRASGRFYKLLFNVRRPCSRFTWISSRLSHRSFLSFIQSRSLLRSLMKLKNLRYDSREHITN